MKSFDPPKDAKDYVDIVRRNLRAYRKKAGLTLRDVTDALRKKGIEFSWSSLAGYETVACLFDVRKLKVLSKLYGVESVAYFLLEFPPDLSKEELTARIIEEPTNV